MLFFFVLSFLTLSLSQQGEGELCSPFLTCDDKFLCGYYPFSCDPACGGSNCEGICVDASDGYICGGIQGLQCPEDLVCIDDPRDKCSPHCGSDCIGICVKPVDTCKLPVDPGPCKGSFTRYYFDSNNPQHGTCKEFTYGGCLGNKNNFETIDECFESCLGPVCLQPRDGGSCRGACGRYYYNPLSNSCEELGYGCCFGNQNNFETEKECKKECKLPRRCTLEPDIGPCDGSCPRWYYDPFTRTCKEFYYGCCRGNRNRFKSEKECYCVCERIQTGARKCRFEAD